MTGTRRQHPEVSSILEAKAAAGKDRINKGRMKKKSPMNVEESDARKADEEDRKGGEMKRRRNSFSRWSFLPENDSGMDL